MANKRNQTLGEELANAISHGTRCTFKYNRNDFNDYQSENCCAIVGVVIFGTTTIILM